MQIYLPAFVLFQSTLPYGSDSPDLSTISNVSRISIHAPLRERRGLEKDLKTKDLISIHAPLRERPVLNNGQYDVCIFQSTLPYGSDCSWWYSLHGNNQFQSTLPYGSDLLLRISCANVNHFNPRSLTGATKANDWAIRCVHISIHAPLRERPFGIVYTSKIK